MLVHLNNKQRKITLLPLSVFMGSWLMLLCQTCIASLEETKSHNKASTQILSSCHTPNEEPVTHEDFGYNEYCQGDCNVMTIAVSADKNSELKEKIKFSRDLYIGTAVQLTLSTLPLSTHRFSAIPERAILLPHQTFNVLLI